ncbi:MAG: ISL3 family transposase [Lachnospiraceae bacterium]|nr:ISL3 family transposase [Lachnospiraceae bacterium]
MAKHLTINRRYQLPPDLEIISDVENPALNRIDIRVNYPKQERVCPNCGFHHCVIKDSGRDQTVRHLPAISCSVFVTFHCRRFLCKDCGSSYYEPIPWIHERLHMTKALMMDICLKLVDMKSVHAIAAEEMVTDEVVTGVLNTISFDRPAHLPEILCFDEFKGDSGEWNSERERWDVQKFNCNVTDGANHILIDVLPSIKPDYVKNYFMQYSLEERRHVRYFSCDMSNGFISVAKACFPNATICIDMFHVVKRLNDGMDTLRRRIQASLTDSQAEYAQLADAETDPDKRDSLLASMQLEHDRYKLLKNARLLLVTKESSKEELWGTSMVRKRERLERALALSPDLQEMYDRLQEFHVILERNEYSLQRADFTVWLDRCLSSEVPEIRSAATTLKHWRGYIQNTWRNKQVSNGVCEGINNKIKIFKRTSYGVHDFESFRRRLLLVCGSIHESREPATTFRK